MPKVTERLRTQWSQQRSQMLEERLEDQHGNPLPADVVAINDFDIKVLDKLLSLPVGKVFDARQIQADLMKAKGT